MKLFNLADALAGKPVVTRAGKNVIALADLKFDTAYPVVANVENQLEPLTFTREGRYQGQSHSPFDLFMVPVIVTKYANIYPGILTYLFDSEEEANRQASFSDTRIGGKAHKITYEE